MLKRRQTGNQNSLPAKGVPSSAASSEQWQSRNWQPVALRPSSLAACVSVLSRAALQAAAPLPSPLGARHVIWGANTNALAITRATQFQFHMQGQFYGAAVLLRGAPRAVSLRKLINSAKILRLIKNVCVCKPGRWQRLKTATVLWLCKMPKPKPGCRRSRC